eukprot:COSAG02_NODE_33505_length_499_cov_0.612500_1_plen_48_part_10
MGSLGHNGFGNPFSGAQWVLFVNFSAVAGGGRVATPEGGGALWRERMT